MKVVFLQSKSFILSPQKTNPIFDPIIEICNRHGIQWEVWLREKHLTTGYPSKNVRSYCWRDSLATAAFLLFNRVLRLNHIKPYRTARFFLKLFNLFDQDICLFITNALLCVNEFSILYPSVPIIEVQHGILYPSHFAYFNTDGIMHRNYLNSRNLKFWLFGQGYKDCLCNNKTNEKNLEGRISIIGDLRRNGMDSFEKGGKEIKTLIVIASQIVLGHEFSPETLLKMKLSYELTINEILKILKKNHLESKYKILFRHHPRFNDCINFSDWKEKFPSLEMNDTRDWNEIYPETKCLLTLNSTSAFDAAAYGVPTIIIKGKFNGFRNILEEDFHYPLNSLTVETCLLQDQQEYQKDCKTAFQWYQKYYELFSRDNCWHLLEQLISSP